MLCPNCSAPISDTAKFCSNCGTNIAPTQGSPYASAAAAGAAAAQSPYQAAAQAEEQAQAEQSPFERGYQKGYAWATGESSPEPDWQQQAYQRPSATYTQPATPVYDSAGSKSKVVAGLLGIFLGSLGIHKFYLGYSREGLIMLLLTIIGSMLTFGLSAAAMEIIGIVEGIIYLVKPDNEFRYTYEYGHKGWF